MNGPKTFLERWSRRKLESDAPGAASADKTALPAVEKSVGESPAQPKAAPAAEIDPATLPSIESIVADTDVRAFLQKGVSAALTRAALRRAWSADPAIRDFVGLSENSWDFTAPDSIPGFGPLDAGEGRRLAAQFFGNPDKTIAANRSTADRISLPETTSLPEKSSEADLHEMRDATSDASETMQPVQENKSDKKADVMIHDRPPDAVAASQHREENDEHDPASPRPRHGGALPK